ncbi:hornerin-like [Scophthalmus maximus]|uniref:hornerin-like n=1 Tax=Scophthalmus maximus TaxID=52904 RepID=UPI001FA91834|nr:hornerin-like [Scophthalmus maximus]
MASWFQLTSILLVCLLSGLEFSSAFPRERSSEYPDSRKHFFGNRYSLQYLQALGQPQERRLSIMTDLESSLRRSRFQNLPGLDRTSILESSPLAGPRSFGFGLKVPSANFLVQSKKFSPMTHSSDSKSGGSYRPSGVQGKGSINDDEISKASFDLRLSVAIPSRTESSKTNSSNGDNFANVRRPGTGGFVQSSNMEPPKPQSSSTQRGSEERTNGNPDMFSSGHVGQYAVPTEQISQGEIPTRQSPVFSKVAPRKYPTPSLPQYPQQSDNVYTGYDSAQVNPSSNVYGQVHSEQTVSPDPTNNHLFLSPSEYEGVPSGQDVAGPVKPSGNHQTWKPVGTKLTFASENHSGQQPSYYSSQQPSYYSSQQPSYYSSHQPSYYSSHQPSYYSSQQPSYYSSQQPSYYSSQQPSYYSSHQPSYNSDQQSSYGVGHQPSYNSDQQSSYGVGHQPSYNSDQQSSYGVGHQPSYNSVQQSSYGVGHQPSYGVGHQPSYGVGHQPSYNSDQQSSYAVGHQPFYYSGQQPSYGVGHQPSYGVGHQPSYSSDQQSSYGVGHQPSYNSDQQSSYGAGHQPSYNSDQQSSYGAGHQPSYNSDQQSSYGAGHQPSYNSDQQLSYGAGRQPFYYSGHQPSYGVGHQPSYNSDQQSSYGVGHQPSYNSEQQSSYGVGHQPSYNSDQQSSYGVGHQPSYNSDQQSSYGVGQQPSYGHGPKGETVPHSSPVHLSSVAPSLFDNNGQVQTGQRDFSLSSDQNSGGQNGKPTYTKLLLDVEDEQGHG